MRRTKTMLMGDLLEEFFKRPYVAAKVAEGKLPDTWRARSWATAPRRLRPS